LDESAIHGVHVRRGICLSFHLHHLNKHRQAVEVSWDSRAKRSKGPGES
jgi:hypothetical protein